MKKFILLLIIVTGSYPLQAQLLKKIKDKAAKALEPKKPETNTNSNSGTTETNSNSGTAPEIATSNNKSKANL